MRNDKDFIIELVEQNWYFLRGSGSEITSDEDIGRVALRGSALALEFITNYYLLNDRELMMECVSKCGMALQFVGGRFQNDREVVLTALKNNPNAIEFVGELLREDEQVLQYKELANSVILNIKSLTGHTVKIPAELTDTLHTLRLKIMDHRIVNNDEFRLIHNGKILANNEKTLEHYGIKTEDTIHLVFKLRGG